MGCGIRRVLLFVVFALLPGCWDVGGALDCFDDGELEESYRTGQAEAREVNQREFARGYEEGLALTFEDGWRDGDRSGYEDGYLQGYFGEFGYPWGASEGYAQGHADGELDPDACRSGAEAGHRDGGDAGYGAGFDDAYGPTYDEAYWIGYDDALAACGFRMASTQTDPGDMQTCQALGYHETLDDHAFREGREAGKSDNPEYQAGFGDAYGPAVERGIGPGQRDGFNDGFNDGYEAGYVDAYDEAFFVCYDPAYANGFDDRYVEGWHEGSDAGWGEGYAAGYSAGRHACEQ